jgi:hypothetical protein
MAPFLGRHTAGFRRGTGKRRGRMVSQPAEKFRNRWHGSIDIESGHEIRHLDRIRSFGTRRPGAGERALVLRELCVKGEYFRG